MDQNASQVRILIYKPWWQKRSNVWVFEIYVALLRRVARSIYRALYC